MVGVLIYICGILTTVIKSGEVAIEDRIVHADIERIVERHGQPFHTIGKPVEVVRRHARTKIYFVCPAKCIIAYRLKHLEREFLEWAAGKSIVANRSDHRHVVSLQTCSNEGFVSNHRGLAADHDETGAILEGTVAYFVDAFGYSHTTQILASLADMRRNLLNSRWKDNACQTAVGKGILRDVGYGVGQVHLSQRVVILNGKTGDRRHGITLSLVVCNVFWDGYLACMVYEREFGFVAMQGIV